jgi:hypothetical protein
MAAGSYESIWNASNHPSGAYFYRLQADDLLNYPNYDAA